MRKKLLSARSDHLRDHCGKKDNKRGCGIDKQKPNRSSERGHGRVEEHQHAVSAQYEQEQEHTQHPAVFGHFAPNKSHDTLNKRKRGKDDNNGTQNGEQHLHYVERRQSVNKQFDLRKGFSAARKDNTEYLRFEEREENDERGKYDL